MAENRSFASRLAAIKSASTHVGAVLYEAARALIRPNTQKLTLTDMDGTLYPYVMLQEDIRIDPQARQGVIDLSRIPGMRVMAATGGALPRAQGMARDADLPIEIAASNGTQLYVRNEDGVLVERPHELMDEANKKVARAIELVSKALREVTGRDDVVLPDEPMISAVAHERHVLYLEIKGGLTAIHYSGAPELVPVIQDLARNPPRFRRR